MMNRFRTVLLTALFVGSVVATQAVHAEPFAIDVYPAYAPKGPTSPSWNAYVTDAIKAIPLEVSKVGDRTVTPAAYEWVTTPISPLEMIYTDYPSWLASADPSPTFTSRPGVFQSELGNRIHFGLHISGDGTKQFSLDDLSWQLDSDDVTNYFDQQGAFAGGTYSPTRVGIDYGTNNQPDGGAGDDIVYDSGEPGSTLVDELIYVGVGDGFLSQEPAPANNQADIDATLRNLLSNCSGGCDFDLAAIYTLDVPGMLEPVIGQASVLVQIEPGFGGDFNRDFKLNCKDLDMLTPQINAGTNDILYDVSGDQLVNFDDLEVYVWEIKNTYFGDANCDGQFNSDDFVKVFIAGLYENNVPDDAVWSSGDWNADGDFTSDDIVLAFIDGGYELGPKASVSAVPEPASLMLILTGLVGLSIGRRRR